jgi:hypothetical protein
MADDQNSDNQKKLKRRLKMNQSCEIERDRYWRSHDAENMKENASANVDQSYQSYQNQSLQDCITSSRLSTSTSTSDLEEDSEEEYQPSYEKQDKDFQTERYRYWSSRDQADSKYDDEQNEPDIVMEEASNWDTSGWRSETSGWNSEISGWREQTNDYQPRFKVESEEERIEFADSAFGGQSEEFEKPCFAHQYQHHVSSLKWNLEDIEFQDYQIEG